MTVEIGKTTCAACDFARARVNEGRNGTLSIACSECGTSSFVKSPKAVTALRKKLGVPAPTSTPNATSFAEFLGEQRPPAPAS